MYSPMKWMIKYRWIGVILGLLIISTAQAHVKWFIDFDVADPPQSLYTHPAMRYVPILMLIATWGIVIFSMVDAFINRYLNGYLTLGRFFFQGNKDIGLAIARIGTGALFLIFWLVGDIILAPELNYMQKDWIPELQLVIAVTVLFRRALVLTGLGILILFAHAVSIYGLFHMMDYITLVGLAIYLILSSLPEAQVERLYTVRYGILYFALVFSFLWSAVEKIAYPAVFHKFLAQYPFLTMGLDQDFFIITAAFVEFALFFMLLVCGNGMILLALAANILISVGNIYFGKIDAIGHFPINFILIMMLLQGPLPVRLWFFNQTPRTELINLQNIVMFYITLSLFVGAYYGLHYLLYANRY